MDKMNMNLFVTADITEISSNSGGAYGNELTIKGTGFWNWNWKSFCFSWWP